MTILPDLSDLVVEQVSVTTDVTVTVYAASPTASCPCCGTHLPELKSCAKGIQQDKAAVLAGLTLPWSNGPLEGHVNRLKLMKRSMYGRAKLPLLRQQVLHHPKSTQDGKVERSHIQRHVKKSSDLAHTSSSKPLAVSLSEVA